MKQERKQPSRSPAAQRVRKAQHSIIAKGGAHKHFLLSADAIQALHVIRQATGARSDTQVIEALLREAARKVTAGA